MRYDAAIIGAGADGLTAAATLAKAGLNVVVLERAPKAGGRLATLEFHPGHFASLYADAVPEVPPAIARALSLDLRSVHALPDGLRATRDAALARAFAEAMEAPAAGALAKWLAPPPQSWPGEDLAIAELVFDLAFLPHRPVLLAVPGRRVEHADGLVINAGGAALEVREDPDLAHLRTTV